MPQPCVLVAEDAWSIAADLCKTVEEAGFHVEGPHCDISSAMLAFEKHRPDVAILDVQLDEGTAYALARKLADEQVPIILHSWRYTNDEVLDKFPGVTTMARPCPPAQMIATVNQVLRIA